MTIEIDIVSTPKPDRFKEQLGQYLSDGWEPIGDMVISNNGGMTMVLKREAKKTTEAGIKEIAKAAKKVKADAS